MYQKIKKKILRMLNFVYIPSPLSDLKTGLEWEKKKKKEFKEILFLRA